MKPEMAASSVSPNPHLLHHVALSQHNPHLLQERPHRFWQKETGEKDNKSNIFTIYTVCLAAGSSG